ncbi:hypothetical protein Tco_1020164 [Tanacetum coccineum]|uniref:Uncharacterized protein n=1 Tax=Tanacetum coccineum TaxID=301880 RepID=A0ABQ5FZN4_9ASTR
MPTVNRNPLVNRSTNRNNVDINSGIDTQMLNQLIATRVTEALAAAAVTRAASTQEETNRGSNLFPEQDINYKEFSCIMHEKLPCTESAELNPEMVETCSSFCTFDTLIADTLESFRRLCSSKFDVPSGPRVRRKLGQHGNGMGETTTTTTPQQNNNNKPTSTRTNAQRQQGCLQPGKVLMLASYLTAESVDDTTLTHALLLVTTVERQDIRPKTAELHLVPQPKEDLEAKEDREAMSLVLDVVEKDYTRTSVQTMGIKAVGIKFEATRKTLRTIKGRIKGTLREITKHQPVLKEDAGHLAEYTTYVPKLR